MLMSSALKLLSLFFILWYDFEILQQVGKRTKLLMMYFTFQKEMGSVFMWKNVLKLPAIAQKSLNKAFNRYLFATNVTISLTLSGMSNFLKTQIITMIHLRLI